MRNAERRLPDWPRAHGISLFQGLIKQSPGDFKVDETIDIDLTGDGEHDWLRICKTNANTGWVARGLAKHAGVPLRDVGYAGLKDRHAVTTQWFSVRRPGKAGTDWNSLAMDGVSVVEQRRHGKKLRRGAHAGNAFQLVVREATVDPGQLAERLGVIREQGVPNYFGLQRFGRGGSNLELAERLFAGQRMSRERRSFAISSARSFLFNEVLAARVRAGTWNRILDGEAVNLDGSGSYFLPETIDDELLSRLDAFDIHPTGPLWGEGDSGCSADFEVQESAMCDAHRGLIAGLIRLGARMDRRALRIAVRDICWTVSAGVLEISFRLGRGCYATAVLREFMSGGDGEILA